MNTARTSDLVTLGTCHNCQGLGRLDHFGHVASGVCFTCAGDGWKLYLDRSIRNRPMAEWPRSARLELIRQALASFDACDTDDFLKRHRKARRTWLAVTITDAAKASEPAVFDRAIAALHKVSPRNWDKVAALRAKTFGPVEAVAAE